MIQSIRNILRIPMMVLSLLMVVSLTTVSCKKKAELMKRGTKKAASQVLKHFATYFFGIAFLMRTEEILAEKMFETFSAEPVKEMVGIENVIVYNNHSTTITLEITTDGRQWGRYEIVPKDSIVITPNIQGLAFINTYTNGFVQLHPSKEYAVKMEDGKKVVDEIQRQ